MSRIKVNSNPFDALRVNSMRDLSAAIFKGTFRSERARRSLSALASFVNLCANLIIQKSCLLASLSA